MPSFSAFVLADFEAIVAGVELSVGKGEWVSVQVDDADPAPEGWCLCCTSRSGSDEYGLVPWAHLVSASHAEAEIKALEETRPQASVAAARRLREMTIMLTRGESGTFGLDIDDALLEERRIPRRKRALSLTALAALLPNEKPDSKYAQVLILAQQLLRGEHCELETTQNDVFAMF